MFGIKKNLNLNLIEDEIKQISNSTSNDQSIYQQELDENDNKYIYYKNNKEFTKQIEIFVKVSNNSKKKKIIVIDESASMEFLHLKILESFEKSAEYQSLEGLKLESIKKENSNENLPLKGNVKDYIKNGDLLLCEINANEIWVSTKITMNNTFYNKIIFTCDIKVKKNMKVKTLKEILYKISFNIFLKKYNTLGKSKLNGIKGDKTLVHFIVSNTVFDFNEEDENKNLDELINENSEIKITINFKLLENAIFNRFKRIYLDEINYEINSRNNSEIMDENNNNINNNDRISNNIKINLNINNKKKNDERWKLFKNLSFSNLLKNNKFVNERNYIFYIAKKFCEKYEINKEDEEKLDDEKSEEDNDKFLLKNIYIYNSLNNNSNKNSKEYLDNDLYNDLDNEINNSNDNENKKKYIIILNPNDNEIDDEDDEEENEEEEEEEEEEEKSDDNDVLNKSNDNYINDNNEENKNKKLKFENRPSVESEKSDNILMNNNKNKNFDRNIFKNNYFHKKKIFNSQKTINYFFKNNKNDLIKDFEKLKKKVFIDIINEEKKIDIIKGSIEKIEIPELRNKKFSNIERNNFDLKLTRTNYNIKNFLIEILIILILFIIFDFLIYYSFKKYIY